MYESQWGSYIRKPKAYVLVGLPCSGKSTWAKNHPEKFPVASTDIFIEMKIGYWNIFAREERAEEYFLEDDNPKEAQRELMVAWLYYFRLAYIIGFTAESIYTRYEDFYKKIIDGNNT